jgi:hypothetical protein
MTQNTYLDGSISQAGFRKTMKGRVFSGLPFLQGSLAAGDLGFAVAEDARRGDVNPEAKGMSVKTAGSWQIRGV